MGQIVHFEVRIYGIGNAVHGADGPVHQAEIGLKNKRFHGQLLLFEVIISRRRRIVNGRGCLIKVKLHK